MFQDTTLPFYRSVGSVLVNQIYIYGFCRNIFSREIRVLFRLSPLHLLYLLYRVIDLFSGGINT
jgi:hypothetical protein